MKPCKKFKGEIDYSCQKCEPEHKPDTVFIFIFSQITSQKCLQSMVQHFPENTEQL